MITIDNEGYEVVEQYVIEDIPPMIIAGTGAGYTGYHSIGTGGRMISGTPMIGGNVGTGVRRHVRTVRRQRTPSRANCCSSGIIWLIVCLVIIFVFSIIAFSTPKRGVVVAPAVRRVTKITSVRPIYSSNNRVPYYDSSWCGIVL